MDLHSRSWSVLHDQFADRPFESNPTKLAQQPTETERWHSNQKKLRFGTAASRNRRSGLRVPLYTCHGRAVGIKPSPPAAPIVARYKMRTDIYCFDRGPAVRIEVNTKDQSATTSGARNRPWADWSTAHTGCAPIRLPNNYCVAGRCELTFSGRNR